jgi:hypothetical protein
MSYVFAYASGRSVSVAQRQLAGMFAVGVYQERLVDHLSRL